MWFLVYTVMLCFDVELQVRSYSKIGYIVSLDRIILIPSLIFFRLSTSINF